MCALVPDTITLQRFCRIGLEASVLDESTIRKITCRCGPELIEALNGEVLAAADERDQIDADQVRIEATVVEADVEHPTESGRLTAATVGIA
jgi:IS5 family transposase